MPVRTITTRLALDGEAQFKQSMASINSSMRTLKSETALSEATFKGQANTLEALTAKNKLLTETIDQQKEKIRALEQAVKDSAAVYGENSTTTDRYVQQLNRAKAELMELDRALVDNSKHLREARDSADGAAKSIDGFGNATGQSGDAVDTLANALKAAGVAVALHQIASAMWECVDASVEFESAVAGYNKVAKLSKEELADMKEQFKDLSTRIPATATEIAQVAEAGTRLSIAKKNIMEFSEVMIDLGNVSDLSADQAATALARFANIAGTSATDYERLGSVIVALGNNFATSESEITEMASRLASAGTLAGLTEAQIMALAAAMSSVGIQAEAGGTAMTQTLTAMEKAVTSGGEKLEQFAKIAGMSAQEFADTWGQDPMTAIAAFIYGLAQLDKQGESATLVLDELGLSGVRQSNMLKSLALASNAMTEALRTANTAWEENVELQNTAATFYDTTEAKMTMAANAANNLKIAIGDALAPALGSMAEGGTAALGVMETVIRDNPLLVQGITAVVTVVGLLTTGLTAYSVIAPIVTTATGALAVALHALPFVGIATAVAVAIAGLNSFLKWLHRTKEETEDFNDATQDMAQGAEEAAQEIAEEGEAALEASGALEQLEKVTGDTGSAAQELTVDLKALEKATKEAAETADTFTAAMKEQEKSGSLSLKTTDALIEAGYAAALAIDTETGAVTLNREEYVRLASAKIQAQIAALEAEKQAYAAAQATYQEATAAKNATSAYWELAAAKAAQKLADRDGLASIDTQIAALKRAQASMESYGSAATVASAKSTAASQKVKTQAEEDLAAYKTLKAELDHQRAMDQAEEGEYYRQLMALRDQYLTGDANVSEYRKVTEQIYKYDKALADQESALWSDQTDALVSQLEARVKSVTDQQDKMAGRLSGYGDLFEVKDGDMALNSLQDQIDAIDAYERALSGLRERGVSGGLLDEALGMDIDSATQYANQLLEMEQEQWEEYNRLWEEKQRRAAQVAQDFFREQMDELGNEYNDKLDAALDNLVQTAFSSGEDTAQGLIDGLASMESALYERAKGIRDNLDSILSGTVLSGSQLADAFSTERIAQRYQGVTGQQLQNAVIGGVNALNTATGGAVYPPTDVTLTLDGQVLARLLLDPMRQAEDERPRAKDDT